MNIKISVVKPEQMRPTVDGADWFWTPAGDLEVQVGPMSDWRREVLLAMHETIEAILCKEKGITQEQVDAFDLEYAKTNDNDCDAGDDPSAPYFGEHCVATIIERMLCVQLGDDWSAYENELREKYPGPGKLKA